MQTGTVEAKGKDRESEEKNTEKRERERRREKTIAMIDIDMEYQLIELGAIPKKLFIYQPFKYADIAQKKITYFLIYTPNAFKS